ncbi:MAG: hypothetical protein KZQ63_04010 [Candidatus Thiodiazotropha sp. (ex Lucinoma aequizonata)]|nr:hypothetical protein [Candidatus Thiodiazotropha sp. (ex Lucinoma aequizonata)]
MTLWRLGCALCMPYYIVPSLTAMEERSTRWIVPGRRRVGIRCREAT